MIKKFIKRIKYSKPIRKIMDLMRKLSSDYFEKELVSDYVARGIINLYPYQDNKPWDITLSGTALSINDEEDHEHLNACIRVYARDKDEVKKIISGLVIEAQDMSEFEGFPFNKYESPEELKMVTELSFINLKCHIWT